MTTDEFKYLFDNHFESVRNYIWYRSGNPELAADIAQEAFMKLWEKQPNDKRNLKGLLFKMAGDMFVSNYRKETIALKFKSLFDKQQEDNTPESQMQFDELKSTYEKALNKMDEKLRTVFLMNRVDKLKYHEIADLLQISQKAVEKRMSKAIRFLKQEILLP